MTGAADSSARVVFAPRPATGPILRRIVPYALAVAALVVDGVVEHTVGTFVVAVGIGLLGALPVILLLRFGERIDQAVWIDANGVTWISSGRVLRWSEVQLVRVKRRARIWRLFGVYDWVGFVDGAAARFAARAGTRPAVRRISTRDVDASADDILAAVRRYAPATIRCH